MEDGTLMTELTDYEAELADMGYLITVLAVGIPVALWMWLS
jgi:hypothetical protein